MNKKAFWIVCAIIAVLAAAILVTIIIKYRNSSDEKETNTVSVETDNHNPSGKDDETESKTAEESNGQEESEPDSDYIDEGIIYEPEAEAVKLNDEGHIMLTLEDGSTLDQGYVGGEVSDGSHVVVFVNLDNSILKAEIVEDGMDAEPPEYPGAEGYEFYEWKGDYTDITEDTVITATYTKRGFYHTITFFDVDGQEIMAERVHTGNNAAGPSEIPQREGYVFTGWDRSVMNIARSLDVKATYLEADKTMFIVDNVNAKSGEKNVVVQIRIANNPGICSAKVSVSFSPSLTLKSYDFNEKELEGTCVGPESVPMSDMGTFLWYRYDADLTSDICFVTLTFDVADNAQGMQEITLAYDQEDVFNQNNEDIYFNTVNGAVIVR